MTGLTIVMMKLWVLGSISYKLPHFLPGLELFLEPAIASERQGHRIGVQGQLNKELSELLLEMF